MFPLVLRELLNDGERVLASGLTLLWLMAFSFTLACSVGNATANRGDTVQSKAEAIEKYETAKADLRDWNPNCSRPSNRSCGKPHRRVLR
jgi:hypothetical protein